MSLHFLIDGYNVLYALKEIPTGTWEEKRAVLLHKIRQERPQGKNMLTVVFDSRQGMGDRWQDGDMDVVYTAGETADDWISERVRQVSNPRIMVVVTDDQGLRRLLRGTGSKCIGTKEFWKTPIVSPKPTPLDPSTQDDITDEFRKKWL